MKNKKGKVGDRYRYVKLNNNSIKNKKKYGNPIKPILLMLVLLIITVGISYSFLVLSTNSKKDVTVKAGNFTIAFKDGNSIKIDNAIPLTDAEGLRTNGYSFSVQNTGDINARYSISLEENEVTKNTLDKKYVKYSLKEENGKWSTPTYLSEGLVLTDNKDLAVGSTTNYELKIWLDKDSDNSVQGKYFSAKIVISSVQSNVDGIKIAQPIVNLNGSNYIKVLQNDKFIDPGVLSVYDDKDFIDTSKVKTKYEYFDGENTKEVKSIDTSKLGTYYIYYTVEDLDGNVGASVRTVEVYSKNISKPVITLLGDSTIYLNKGDEFSDPLYTAEDLEDGDLTDKVVTVGSINTEIIGVQTIKYIVEDSDGNTASAIRTVIVNQKGSIKIEISEPKIKEDIGAYVDITIESNDGYIVGYYFTKSSKKPAQKDYIKIKEEKTQYQAVEQVTANNDYYVWAIDSNGNVAHESINTNDVYDKTPVCRFSDIKYIELNKEKEITLTCTDDVSIKKASLTDKSFIYNSNIEIVDITSPTKIEKGYKYKITIEGKNVGTGQLTLKDSQIFNSYSIGNKYETTDDIKVVEMNLDTNNVELDLNKEPSYQLHVLGSVTDLEYTSSDDSVATVTDSGLIEAHKIGTATITVTDKETGIKKKVTVHVKRTITVEYKEQGSGIVRINKGMDECAISEDVKECSFDLPEIFVEDGYTAIGWNKEKTAHTGEYNKKIIVTEKDDNTITYYTIVKKDAINITAHFQTQGKGSVKEKYDDITCTIPEAYNEEIQGDTCNIELPELQVKEGYTARGWSRSSIAETEALEDDVTAEKGYKQAGESVEITDNVTFYTIISKDAIKLTAQYDANGASLEDYGDESLTCTLDEVWNDKEQATTCTVPTPTITREGFDILGFSLNENDTGENKDTIFNGIITLTQENTNKTWYAITKKDITINWDANGANINSNKSTCTIRNKNTTCSITSPKITREDYDLIGFNTNKTAHESIWDKETKKDDITASDDGSTYYAITKKTIKSNLQYYDPDEETVKQKEASCDIYNKEESCDYDNIDDDITKGKGPDDTEFFGFSDKPGSKDIVDNENPNSDKNDYYIVYRKEVTPTYYYYNLEEESQDTLQGDSGYRYAYINENQEKYKVEESSLTVPNEITTSSGMEESSYKGVSNSISSHESIDPTTKYDTYYVWYQGTYAVDYTKDEGIDSITKTKDTCDSYKTTNGNDYTASTCSITLPSITAKEGYTVDGWYDNEEKVGDQNGNYTISKNVTLTAMANAKSYTVTYDYSTNGGSSVDTESTEVTYKSQVDLSVTAEKTDWEFVGWNTDKNAKTGLETYNMPAHNVTLYAIYKKDETATFNYYDSNKDANKEVTCTRYNNDEKCNYEIPEEIKNSTGPEETKYKGISTSTESTETTETYNSSNLVYYAVYEGQSEATIYYHDSTIKTAKVNGIKNGLSNGNNYTVIYQKIEIPDEVTESTGEYGTKYIGVSNTVNTTKVEPIATGTYYAIYQTKVTQYYYDQTNNNQRTIYRNNYFKSNTEMISVLTDTENGITNFDITSLTGKNESTGKSLTTEDNAKIEKTVEEAAKISNDTLYTTYEKSIPINFYYYSNKSQNIASTTGLKQYNYTGDKVVNNDVIIPEQVSTSSGPLESHYEGVSKDLSNKELITPTTEIGNYYAVYKETWSVAFTKQSDGVEKIGSTNIACESYKTTDGENYTGSLCTITLPSISVKKGYTSLGWNTNPLEKTGEKENSKVSIDSTTKTYYTIIRKDAITLTGKFHKNGSKSQTLYIDGIIKELNDDVVEVKCTLEEVYNNEIQDTECQITTPIINPGENTPTVIGYATDKDATVSSLDHNTKLEITEDVEYYAITKKDAEHFTANFDANNATLSFTEQKNCSIEPTYNGIKQSDYCEVDAPTITAPENTPTVVGFNLNSNDKTNNEDYDSNNNKIKIRKETTEKTWYAITKKEAVTYNVKFEIGSHVESISKNSGTCTIEPTYNGEEQSTTCIILEKDLPTVTSKKGYTSIGWSQNKEDTTGSPVVAPNKDNMTFYAHASANHYNINYYNGEEKVSIQIVTYDEPFTLKGYEELNVSKTGYHFDNWKLGETEKTFTDKQKITENLAEEENADVNLYAQFKDDIKPVCTFGNGVDVETQKTKEIILRCTDYGSGLIQTQLTKDDFTVSEGNKGEVESVSGPEKIENGYQYKITVKGLNSGEAGEEFTVILPSEKISDNDGNTNTEVSVKNKTIGRTYTLHFTKGDHVTNITSTSLSCTTKNTSIECNITPPTITPSTGYTAKGWKEQDVATEDSQLLNDNITVTDDMNGKIYEAVAKDETGPSSFTLMSTNDDKWSQSTTITLTATDDGSGIKTYEYKIDDDDWTSNDITLQGSQGTITFSTEQNKTIKFRAVDNDGNYSEEKETKVKIDKTAPKIISETATSQLDNITVNYTLDDPKNSDNTASEVHTTTCKYGTDGKYDQTGEISNNHCKISNLQSNTNYSYKIEATDNANNTNSITGEISTKIEASIGECNNLTYNHKKQTLITEQTGVTYSNNSEEDAGTYTVTGNANENYLFSGNKSTTTKSCTIDRKNSAKYNVDTSLVYDGNSHIGVTAVEDTDTKEVTVSLDGEITEIDAGDYHAQATPNSNYSWPDNKNNYETKIVDWDIDKAASNNPILSGTYSGVYDGLTHTITSNGGNGGTIKYSNDNQSWKNSMDEITTSETDVGNLTVYAKVEGDKNHENTTSTSATIKLTKRSVTCTANTETREYDGTALTSNSGSCTSQNQDQKTGIVSSDTATVTTTGSQTYAGTSDNTIQKVTITHNGKNNNANNNYDITTKEGKLIVTAKNIVCTANGSSKIYDGTELKANGTCSGLVEGDNAAITTTGSQTDVGTATNSINEVKIKHGNDSDTVAATNSYNITKNTGTLTVTARETTCTATSTSKIYDGKALTANNGSCSNLASNEKAIVTAKGTQTNAGSSNNMVDTVTINHGSNNATSNYIVTNESGILTVNQATPNVSLSEKIVTYNGQAVTANDASISGVSGGTIPTGTVSYAYYNGSNCEGNTIPAPINAGTYSAKATISANGNYTTASSSCVAHTINRAKGQVTLGASSGTIDYGTNGTLTTTVSRLGDGVLSVTSSNSAITASISNGILTMTGGNGLVADSTVTITVTAAQGTNYSQATATYTITIKATFNGVPNKDYEDGQSLDYSDKKWKILSHTSDTVTLILNDNASTGSYGVTSWNSSTTGAPKTAHDYVYNDDKLKNEIAGGGLVTQSDTGEYVRLPKKDECSKAAYSVGTNFWTMTTGGSNQYYYCTSSGGTTYYSYSKNSPTTGYKGYSVGTSLSGSTYYTDYSSGSHDTIANYTSITGAISGSISSYSSVYSPTRETRTPQTSWSYNKDFTYKGESCSYTTRSSDFTFDGNSYSGSGVCIFSGTHLGPDHGILTVSGGGESNGIPYCDDSSGSHMYTYTNPTYSTTINVDKYCNIEKSSVNTSNGSCNNIKTTLSAPWVFTCTSNNCSGSKSGQIIYYASIGKGDLCTSHISYDNSSSNTAGMGIRPVITVRIKK